MTDATASAPLADERRFIRNLATCMAVVLVAGFIVQLLLGRSSFDAPLIVHAHAVVFMGWVGIVLTQVWLAGAGNIAVHKQVGKLAGVWTLGLLVFGTWVTVAAVQTGRTPFFFQPQHFLVANPVTLYAAVGLLVAAYAMRKRTDWHARLQIGSFALLMGPGFGRLLPMPFLTPYAFEIAVVAALIFPAIGMLYDCRAHGRPHPAWIWGIGVLIGVTLLARVIGFSPIGEAIYDAVVAGTPLAGTSGLDFPPPPGPPPGAM
ncbi:MAG: hypothetical protein JJU22_08150 [Gammaproteobacteria bacterium]|nr:hypothetical protein [Gammaproteobacteria bacterium]